MSNTLTKLLSHCGPVGLTDYSNPPTPSFQGERAKEVTLIVIFWVVSRCVFAWFWGVFGWWFAVAEAAALDAFAWF